jgi:hypothetical protein
METITILSIITTLLIGVYLFISREKTIGGKSPSNFGIFAILSMIAGIILGYTTGSGWAFALIAHGWLGIVIGIVRLFWKKKEKKA